MRRACLQGSCQFSTQPGPVGSEYSGQVKVKVNDDGTVLVTDMGDNELSPAIVKRVKAEMAEPTGIQKVLVSGYVQRDNPANGLIEDHYVISALIVREQWNSLDFNRLNAIDPASTLNVCGALPRRAEASRKYRGREALGNDAFRGSFLDPGGKFAHQLIV